MPALGVDEDFVFPSDLLEPLLLAVVLLLIMLLMKISLMSISAAEALLSKGVVELPLTLPLPLPLLLSAAAGSVAALLLLAVTLTLADGLLGVLMVVTLVAIPLFALILFIVAGSDDGGVGGPL